jgi:hypothetical protein
MNKTIVAISASVVLLVAIFLAYQVIESRMNPCEGIFQQSSVSLGTKLDIVKAKGEFVIGREKIQDLTEQSQLMAINLKSCCIVAGHTTSDFLRCKEGFDRYDTGINKIASSLIETEAARQQGNTPVANQKLAEITESLKAVDASSREFTTQVRAIEQKASANVTQEDNLNACCEIASNPDLKSLGRLVVAFPKDSNTSPRVDIFKVGDSSPIQGTWGSMTADLIPGRYVVAISGRRVEGVEVQAGHNTRIRVGALRVHTGSGTRVDVFERGGKNSLVGFWGASDVGLPVGQYDVQIAGQRATVAIKENSITEF